MKVDLTRSEDKMFKKINVYEGLENEKKEITINEHLVANDRDWETR